MEGRNIPAAPEPRQPDAHAAEETCAAKAEAESLAAWWQQFEAAAQTTEAAIATERENAIAAGQPWPPRPTPATEPAVSTTPILEWDEPDPQAAHVDPEWHAQISAAQTARVQADKAARREASARACPVTDAEIALYGAHHHLAAAEREPLLTAPAGHDAHETTSQYHARMQSYAQWQPETHPEATTEMDTKR